MANKLKVLKIPDLNVELKYTKIGNKLWFLTDDFARPLTISRPRLRFYCRELDDERKIHDAYGTFIDYKGVKQLMGKVHIRSRTHDSGYLQVMKFKRSVRSAIWKMISVCALNNDSIENNDIERANQEIKRLKSELKEKDEKIKKLEDFIKQIDYLRKTYIDEVPL